MDEGSSELLPQLLSKEIESSVEMVFEGSEEVMEHLVNKEKYPERKIALVITGGGPKVSIPFGYLEGLERAGVLENVDLIVAESSGAAAGIYGVSQGLEEGVEFLKAFVQNGVSKTRFPPMDFDMLQNGIRADFDEDALKRLRGSQTELLVGVTDVETGQARFFDPRRMPDPIMAVMASMAQPFLCGFKTYEIDGRKYYEGGWSDPLPIKKALQEGATDVLVIFQYPPEMREPWLQEKIPSWFLRSTEETLTYIALKTGNWLPFVKYLNVLRSVAGIRGKFEGAVEIMKSKAIFEERSEMAEKGIEFAWVAPKAPLSISKQLSSDGVQEVVDSVNDWTAADIGARSKKLEVVA